MWSEAGRTFQADAPVRAKAPRWELMIRVQGTEGRPKGVGAGNEVGKARSKKRKKIGFESKGHGSLNHLGEIQWGPGPGQGSGGGEKWWDCGIS